MPYKIAIFASGSGTNAENIARTFASDYDVQIDLAITDRKEAGVTKRMDALGIDTFHVPAETWKNDPQKIANFLKRRDIDIIVLAGFLRYVAPEILEAFPGRVLNIHPSLLPDFGGKGMWGHKVHEAVIEAKATKSGATVHKVTEEMDAGEIVMSQEVDVLPDDNADTLEQKVHQAEYELYPKAIRLIIDNLKASEETNPQPQTPDSQWARTLGVDYDPAKIEGQTPTPPRYIPQSTPTFNADSQFAANPDNAHSEEQMPSTYLIWCILFIIFCCAPAAIVALVYSLRISSKWYAGDYHGARKASEITQRWLIASFVIGVIEATIFIPLWLFSGF